MKVDLFFVYQHFYDFFNPTAGAEGKVLIKIKHTEEEAREIVETYEPCYDHIWLTYEKVSIDPSSKEFQNIKKLLD